MGKIRNQSRKSRPRLDRWAAPLAIDHLSELLSLSQQLGLGPFRSRRGMRRLPRSRRWRLGSLEHRVMPFEPLHVGGVLSDHPLEEIKELGCVLRLRAKRVQKCAGG